MKKNLLILAIGIAATVILTILIPKVSKYLQTDLQQSIHNLSVFQPDQSEIVSSSVTSSTDKASRSLIATGGTMTGDFIPDPINTVYDFYDALNKQNCENAVLIRPDYNIKYCYETEKVPFETKYEKDPDSEYGTEKTKQDGKDGEINRKYLLTYWQEETIDKQLIDTQKVEPTDEIILKGSKIVWRLLEGTENGRLKYWHKMRVWATKYDANCYGCTGRTYSGTEVKKGVCATDPKVIPLGTNFYVEGYGLCRAEDIGGAIKGNKVDLGFVDASKGNWGAAYTNVYLLTNAPE